MYSDGIPEAWTRDGIDYGEERLRRVLETRAGQAPRGIRDAVLTDVKVFLEDALPSDDMTLVLIKRKA